MKPLVLAGAILLGYVTGCTHRASLGLTQSVPSVPELIDRAAADYGIPGAARHLRAIAWCESRFFPGAYNRSSGASGLFQFVPRTWAATPQGQAGLSPYDAEANARAAAWLYARSGGRPWVCR
jgi:soluble lytic murein transglycosylase-like protein